ncbi:NAD(P)/FAD-dependent oxidoreductase [Chthonobacter albigriseus]|uniref:NAD(P)/FAD-dependent oxidoreductase n=1 Tax=Chthonobacter albigriseus TaxID=1683161 RepID=UPI0015EFBEB2|nr:FAD-binding oxidoreductase [Chthonobacter albigriseus]
MRSDAVVLGAGIVGVSVALHLQARGRSVVLVDRKGVAEETSHGNAGLIERASVIPYSFPRDLPSLIRYGLNGQLDARYHLGFLPRIAGWLFQYWRHSSPKRLNEAAAAMLPLIERCVIEHEVLTQQAGTGGFVSRRGWIDGYRTEAGLQAAIREAEGLGAYGLSWQHLDRAALKSLEPDVTEAIVGAIHWRDPASVSDPGGVAKGYAALFVERGGRIVKGDARTLAQSGSDWTVEVEEGLLTARDAVVALGPWSNDVLKGFGYRIPLAVKRGYHMHYAPAPGKRLNHTLLDAERGYVLAPMQRGIRLTTGVEFADRDAPPTPVQLDRSEPVAREIFPIAERLDPEPWLGRRPAIPDMRPVIGAAPRHRGLWMAFGHAHHGFTLGPVTGRLLAELITGEDPIVDPTPYSPARFR